MLKDCCAHCKMAAMSTPRQVDQRLLLNHTMTNAMLHRSSYVSLNKTYEKEPLKGMMIVAGVRSITFP